MLRRARRLVRRYAISSVVSQYSRPFPTGRLGEGREIELQLARGLSLFTAKGFSAVEGPEAYTRARELAERRGDPRQQFMAVYGLWQSANGAGRIHDCRRLSDQLLQLTVGEADDGLHLQAHHSAWATSMFAGDPAQPASTARRGGGSMILSDTGLTACCMAGTIPACAPAASVRLVTGY
jgi:hypothetical protein